MAQSLERLGEVQHPGVPQGLGPEAGVEQVHDAVLGAADVEVHRHPAPDGIEVKGLVVLVRAAEAQKIPTRAGEAAQGVGFTPRRAAAGRTRGVDPILGGIQGRAPAQLLRVDLVEMRQQHRQLVLRHGDLAAVFAVHDGNRRAPIALARDQPVAQLVVDRKVARALVAQPLGDRVAALAGGRPVEPARIDHRPFVQEGLRQRLPLPIGRGDHGADFQAVLGGEVEVALVVGRHGHDCARAVGHQHVVGDPNGNALAVNRVDRVAAGEHARLVVVQRHPLQLGLARGGGHVSLHLVGVLRRG